MSCTFSFSLSWYPKDVVMTSADSEVNLSIKDFSELMVRMICLSMNLSFCDFSSPVLNSGKF